MMLSANDEKCSRRTLSPQPRRVFITLGKLLCSVSPPSSSSSSSSPSSPQTSSPPLPQLLKKPLTSSSSSLLQLLMRTLQARSNFSVEMFASQGEFVSYIPKRTIHSKAVRCRKHQITAAVTANATPNAKPPVINRQRVIIDSANNCGSSSNSSGNRINNNSRNCSHNNNFTSSLVMLMVVLYHSALCDSHATNLAKAKSFIELTNGNARSVRSFSEEFMTSSEERERGLQFFGGSSAGITSETAAGVANSRHRIVPYFDTETFSTNVTVSEGSAFVHLPCRVKQLGERTLSWIRRKDLQILTVGKFTYTSDLRLQAIHLENSDDWSLQISYPKKSDAGIYECQVATMPKMSLFVQLNVVVRKARILEGPTLYLSSGLTLNLTCVVRDTPEPPDYIFWYYNGQVINYGSPRGIKVHTEKSTQTVSKLAISKAQPNDSGNYSCTPSNAESAHIAVHIHNNANPAASIQHGKRSAREFGSNSSSSSLPPNCLTIVCIAFILNAIDCYRRFPSVNPIRLISHSPFYSPSYSRLHRFV